MCTPLCAHNMQLTTTSDCGRVTSWIPLGRGQTQVLAEHFRVQSWGEGHPRAECANFTGTKAYHSKFVNSVRAANLVGTVNIDDAHAKIPA